MECVQATPLPLNSPTASRFPFRDITNTSLYASSSSPATAFWNSSPSTSSSSRKYSSHTLTPDTSCHGDNEDDELAERNAKRARLARHEKAVGRPQVRATSPCPPAADIDMSEADLELKRPTRFDGHRQSVFSSVMGMRSGSYPRRSTSSFMRPTWSVGQLNHLDSFVSSQVSDVLLIPSSEPMRDWAPPICLAFSNASKQSASERGLLAVGSEEGCISLFSVDQEFSRSSFTRIVEPPKKLSQHNYTSNALFSIAFSPDDDKILTASGSQDTRVVDVETGRSLYTLCGHTSSVKTAVWDPLNPAVIASAGRDGHILVYDLREGVKTCALSESEPISKSRGVRTSTRLEQASLSSSEIPADGFQRSPRNKLTHAHGHQSKKQRPPAWARTATRSPTCLSYLPTSSPHQLLSAGSSDGILKLWDLRVHGSQDKKAIPVAVEEGGDPSRRGIVSMVVGDGYVWTAGTDSRIQTNSLSTLQPLPSAYTSPSLSTTFYSHLSLSPDGKTLAMGSSTGGVHLWEVNQNSGFEFDSSTQQSTVLNWNGHYKEVSGLDWGSGVLATASDDLTVRLWRSNHEASQEMQNNPDKASMDWAGKQPHTLTA